MKRFIPITLSIQEIKKKTGWYFHQSTKIADIFNKYSHSVFTTDDSSNRTNVSSYQQQTSKNHFHSQLHLSDSIKSQTLFLIWIWWYHKQSIKNCAAGLSISFCHIFKCCFNMHEIPLDSSLAYATPPQKTMPYPIIYRPTSFMSSCCPTMEQVISKEILS